MMVTKLGPNHPPRKSTKALFDKYCRGLLNRSPFEAAPTRKSLKTRRRLLGAKGSTFTGFRPMESCTLTLTPLANSKEARRPSRACPIGSEIVTAFSHWARVSMTFHLPNITRDWTRFVRLLCWLLQQVKWPEDRKGTSAPDKSWPAASPLEIPSTQALPIAQQPSAPTAQSRKKWPLP
jgi:hypothetical protein